MNFLPVRLSDAAASRSRPSAAAPRSRPACPPPSSLGGDLRLGIRAEAIHARADGTLPGTVEVVERLGDRTHLHVRLADGSLLIAEDKGVSAAKPADQVRLAIDADTAHVFDAAGRAYHAS